LTARRRSHQQGKLSFWENRHLRLAAEIVAIAAFCLLLVVTCLGASLALVSFQPVNMQLLAFAHSDSSPKELQAYQNVATQTLRYVTILPFETAFTLQPSAADLATLQLDSFSPDELSHLTDVRILLGGSLLLTYVVGAAAMLVLGLTYKTRFARRSLLAAGISCFALPLVGLAVLLRAFDPAFDLFHQLLFPQGNWEFYTTTLVISTFPEHYWQAAGILWMVFFLLGGLILVFLSRFCGKMPAQSVTNAQFRVSICGAD